MRFETRRIEIAIAESRRQYKEIASAAGITERTLQNARYGRRIQPATAGRIADALGIDVDRLLMEERK